VLFLLIVFLWICSQAVCLSVCLFVCLSVCVSVCVSVKLSNCQTVKLSNCQFVCFVNLLSDNLFFCQSVSLSINLSIKICVYEYDIVCLPIYTYIYHTLVCLIIHLLVSRSVSLRVGVFICVNLCGVNLLVC
jgi:hypothetical protein